MIKIFELANDQKKEKQIPDEVLSLIRSQNQ